MNNFARLAALLILVGGLAGCRAATDVFRVSVQTIDWFTDAEQFRGNIGERYQFDCPANASGEYSRLGGTGVYTDDSSICAAAAHVGTINWQTGGRAMIEIRAGQQSYRGSTMNEFTSDERGSHPGSFVVLQSGS